MITIFRNVGEITSSIKSNIPYEQLKVYTDIHLVGSPNWVRVATSPINDGVVLITYFNGYGKDAVALKDEYINFKVAKNYDFFQISIANFLVTGESVMSVRLH
jgi:cell wall assembly regulator SMI1